LGGGRLIEGDWKVIDKKEKEVSQNERKAKPHPETVGRYCRKR